MDSYFKIKLTLDELTQTLEQVLDQAPEHSAQMLSILTTVHTETLLPRDVYSVLKSHIEPFVDKKPEPPTAMS